MCLANSYLHFQPTIPIYNAYYASAMVKIYRHYEV